LSREIESSVIKLLSRFQAFNQNEHHQTRRLIAAMKAKQAGATTVEEITSEIEMLDISSAEEEKLRRTVEVKVLEELAYESMTSRYENVLHAHPQTFDWIFSDVRGDQPPWSDFTLWLRDQEGIYWVNGKAGSGKSTLMKHIYDDARTKHYLLQWARKTQPVDTSLCFVSYFFWYSGTGIQKSQSGLLRSLLFQILYKYPSLIPIVLPDRWARHYSGIPDFTRLRQIVDAPWPIKQLTEAFGKSVRQREIPLKLCVFVDGLDEFDGEADQLCMLFKEAVQSNPENSKFCLSSRPWVEFQEGFADCASLRLQDLTFEDVSRYVSDRFRQNPAFARLEARDPHNSSELLREIVEKADGVFLWVEVVVKQLLRGLNNRDSISQLWERLRSFPRELFPLYEKILSQIEPIYLEWASKAFQTMRLTHELSYDPFHKISTTGSSSQRSDVGDTGPLPLTAAGLFLALEEDCDIHAIKSSRVDELERRCEDIPIHLTARCAGLLEVASSRNHGKPHQQCEIGYMHRTARDFLEKEKQWEHILSYSPPLIFSPSFAMMRACIRLLVISPSRIRYPLNNARMAQDALIYAYHADGDVRTRNAQFKLLKDLAGLGIPWIPLVTCPSKSSFLERATKYSLANYVNDILSTVDEATRTPTVEGLLDTYCRGTHLLWKEMPLPNGKMVRTLMELRTPSRTNLSSRKKIWKDWPTVIGFIPQTIEIIPAMIPRFLRCRISILQIFLEMNQDPTHTLGYIPEGFTFCSETLHQTVLDRLDPECIDPKQVLDALNRVLQEAIQTVARTANGTSKKRKSSAALERRVGPTPGIEGAVTSDSPCLHHRLDIGLPAGRTKRQRHDKI
jgi:NACHT domain